MQLSPEQQAVVNSNEPTTVVLAGAGSGKTRVVVARIDRFIKENYSSSDIFAISFTRKAGKELQSRLSSLAKGVWCGTLHSLCLDICQREEGNINVISEEEANILLEECGKSLGLVNIVTGKWEEKTLDFWRKLVDEVRSGTPAKTRHGNELAKLYESKLKIGGECDYFGLLNRALKHINNGHLKHIRHLFVDEAQDIDKKQWEIIETIVKLGNKCRMTVVGDAKQSIYAWRGAVPNYLLNLSNNPFTLVDNYRSPRIAVEASNQLIAQNPEGTVRMHYTKSEGGLRVEEWETHTSVRYYLDMFYRPGDIAVLCRTNREVDYVANVLENQDIPVFKPTPPVALDPVAAVLAMGVRPTSHVAWAVFCKTMKNYISIPKSQQFAAIELECSPTPIEHDVGISIQSASTQYAMVGDVLPNLKEYFSVEFWNQFLGYQVAKALAQRSVMDASEDEQGDRVAVMTIHQSKGLEFPVVIVPSMNQGNLPIKSSLKDNNLVEEERRLCYVAWTRTMESLCLLIDGTKQVSQFIQEGLGNAFDDRQGIFGLTTTPF